MQRNKAILAKRTGKRSKGMTLFELAVVVLISVVLIGLALLSTRSLVTRTKVSRVKEEHRALSRALQNYIMDYSFMPAPDQGLGVLTRPTAYFGKLPSDPFQQGQGTYLYLGPQSNEVAAVLISPGPDGDFDLPPELWRFAARKGVNSDLIPWKPSRLNEMTGMAWNAKAAPPTYAMDKSDEAILSTYFRLGQYDPEKGEDGDIITMIRY